MCQNVIQKGNSQRFLNFTGSKKTDSNKLHFSIGNYDNKWTFNLRH